MERAEALERSTKAKGQRDGVLGQSALMVLRALLCHFLDTKSGRCDPSYKQIQKQTGFCVQTIAVALKRLERAGILDITRRIVRRGAQLWNELVGPFCLARVGRAADQRLHGECAGAGPHGVRRSGNPAVQA